MATSDPRAANAALYMHADAYETAGAGVLGRQSAGESFLRGFLRHGDIDTLHLWHAGGATIEALDALVRRIEPPRQPIRWIATGDRGSLAQPGVLHTPGPTLAAESWGRRPFGDTRYSICGLTHTTATGRTMDNIADLLIAPVQDYDALICTSQAVRASVEANLEGVRDYLAGEYGGPRRRAEPQRVTIPLGVNVDDFATSPGQRKAWRERLAIPDEAVAALYVGRFNAAEKMNPALMAIALERAAQQLSAPLCWVNAGWSNSPRSDAAYHAAARALCPSVRYIEVDGRPAETRFSIWSVADLFISFSDNIQETFGLTPVEAMAAGLPSVVTDWNGYRDTIRHGEDGFRVPTLAPGPGEGADLAYRHASGWLRYTDYVGAAAQFTAIDYAAATEAIVALASSPDLRRTLGGRAQSRARAVFDWAAIIPQYQALWGELNARRLASPVQAPIADNPFRPDPFRLFAAYPTHSPGPDWRATLSPGTDWAQAHRLLASPLAAYGDANRPSLRECEAIVTWLTGRPGASIADVAGQFPASRRPAIARGLLWIARFGIIELRPPD